MIQQNPEFCESTRERVPNPVLEELPIHILKKDYQRQYQEEEDHFSLESHHVHIQETTVLRGSVLKQNMSHVAKLTIDGSGISTINTKGCFILTVAVL